MSGPVDKHPSTQAHVVGLRDVAHAAAIAFKTLLENQDDASRRNAQYCLRKLQAALNTRPSLTRRVMPIIWIDRSDGNYVGPSIVGDYEIGIPHRTWNLTTPEGVVTSHETPDEAKSAALADYSARVLSAIYDEPEAGDWINSEIVRLRAALNDVTNPLEYLRRHAEADGNKLNGMAYQIANDLHFVQKIAKDALEQGVTSPVSRDPATSPTLPVGGSDE